MFCVRAGNEAEESAAGQALTFTTPAVPPSIEAEFATEVTSTSAVLNAQVNPGGAATTYHFEYGTTSAYGQSTPESASVGSDDTSHRASAPIQGLAPATSYHYRVVATSPAAPSGVPDPKDHTFTTQAAGGEPLPDNRVYELITPIEKGDGTLPVPSRDSQSPYSIPLLSGSLRASPDGERFVFTPYTQFPGAQDGAPGDVLASRGPAGWSTRALDPPQAATNTNTTSAVAYSRDLSRQLLLDEHDAPALVAGEPQNNQNLFLQNILEPSFQLVNTSPAPARGVLFEAASADLRTVVFGVGGVAAKEETVAEVPEELLVATGGTVSRLGEVPLAPATSCGEGGPPCTAIESLPGKHAFLGSAFDHVPLNAVSNDGSKIVFGSFNGERDLTELYVRENGTRTVEVSASQKTNATGPGGPDPENPFEYRAATPDGSKVFFSSCKQLTNDSTAVVSAENKCSEASNRSGEDLYSFDTGTNALVDLTVDHNGDPRGADIRGVLGTSEDGSYVYFSANGVLSSNGNANGEHASLGTCAYGTARDGTPEAAEQEAETCNLYVAHDGVTSFIATLSGRDQPDWEDGHVGSGFRARVTPDGMHLAFQSRRSVTGFDNLAANGVSCGKNSFGYPLPAACGEVFLYSASSAGLVCASCDPSGARPTGEASIPPSEEAGSGTGFGWDTGLEYLPHNLSDDGSRLFFETVDALVPGDTNHQQDVYEFVGGRARLVSSGTSAIDSSFLDATPSGSDVFFETQAQLVSQDKDQSLDIYDARVGGGFPTAGSTACSGSGCQGVPLPPPVFATPASTTFAGTGNFPAAGRALVKRPTRAELLRRALKACKRFKQRKRRVACEKAPKRRYGVSHKTRRANSHRGAHS